MAVNEMASVIKSCISPTAICKVMFGYQQYEEFFFPVAISDELFLSVSDRDFRLDGFTVRQLSDITSATPIKGTYLKIHQAEGNLSRLSVPPINIRSWRHVFNSILASGEIISIEGYAPNSVNKYFIVGRVLAVGEQGIRVRTFDGSGTWAENPITVPYKNIFSMTFGSSYITTYSKYVKPYPEIKTPTPIKNR